MDERPSLFIAILSHCWNRPSRIQRSILWIGGGLLLLSFLVVPWKYEGQYGGADNLGYQPIFLPPTAYNGVVRPAWGRVATTAIIVVVATAGSVAVAGQWGGKDTNDTPVIPPKL